MVKGYTAVGHNHGLRWCYESVGRPSWACSAHGAIREVFSEEVTLDLELDG